MSHWRIASRSTLTSSVSGTGFALYAPPPGLQLLPGQFSRRVRGLWLNPPPPPPWVVLGT